MMPRLIENIVECKADLKEAKKAKGEGLIENIVECKDVVKGNG